MAHPPAIAEQLAASRCSADAVLRYLEPGSEVLVGLANGEPATVLDAIEAAADGLRDIRLHQMFPLRSRRYIDGAFPGLRHVSWFLSPPDRDAFHRGACDLVPNSFSEVPKLLRRATRCALVLTAAAPPDRHGYFSLGVHADYCAAMIGHVPFCVEVTHTMPRTVGANQVHISQLVGWCEAEYPLIEVSPAPPRDVDGRIADLVAERIPDGATLQVGVGSVPEQVLRRLGNHKHLGVHTELFGEGFIDLVEAGVVTGTRKRTHPGKIVTTGALGTRRLYDFVDENVGIEFWPVDYTNDPRQVALEDHFVAVNASLEVDFLGQCASESLGSTYWSSSGGQPDFARGADTPVCTKQLCNYRDNLAVFGDLGVQVIAINPQSEESHRKFADKHAFPFPVVADATKAVCKQYGALNFLGMAKRALVLIGRDGTIKWRRTDFPIFHQTAADVKQAVASLAL